MESTLGLATSLERQHRTADAEKLQRQVVEKETQILSPDSRVLLVSKANLADTLLTENRFAEAEKLLREIVDSDRRVLGPDHPNTLDAMNSLANTLMEAGKYSEAETVYNQVHTGNQQVRPDSPDAAITLYNLGCVTAHLGRKAESISFLTEAVDHGLPAYGDLGIDKDPDLSSLHGDPRFALLVAHAKGAAAAMKRPAVSSVTASQKTKLTTLAVHLELSF